MQSKEPYKMPTCRRCGGEPKVEHDNEFHVRIVCPKCGTRTAKTNFLWVAQEDGEDMQL